MLRLTPALAAEFAHFNAGVQAARHEYARTLVSGTDCPTGNCRLDRVLCATCRRRIHRHIDNSVDVERREQLRAEYAYLLDLPERLVEVGRKP